jgi:endo-1,4-beta-mannosidase
MEDLEEDRHLGPREAAEACDFLTMHGYPIYARWAEGPLDHALVPFLARIASWLGGGKDVFFSEFGLPTFRASDRAEDAPRPESSVDEEAAASYTGRVLDGLRDAGASGAMLWCYADYAPERWADPPLDEAPHERSFGLWRADGSAKPAVPIIQAAAGRARVAPPADGWIDIDREQFWERPGVELPRLYARYRARHPV